MRADGKPGRAFTLVEILVVVVILAVLAFILLPRLTGGTTAGKKSRAPIVMARDTVCQEYLRQVRAAVEMARQSNENEQPPQTLTELRLPAETLQCPTGHEPYQYDPASGRVWCPHPGHERY